jgi:hypothetical protein
MSEGFWTQISAAVLMAIFALQLLDRVFTFLSKKKNGQNGASGDRPVDYWQGQFKGIVSDALTVAIVPILRQQANILEDLKTNSQRHTEMLLKASYTMDELKEGQAAARAGVQSVRESVTVALGRLQP